MSDCMECDIEDEDLDEDYGSQNETYILRLTKQQVEELLQKGRISGGEIGIDCIDCSNEISIDIDIVINN